MKLLAIGDVHGLDTWKEIVAKHPDAEKVIFIGDYVDSFDIKPLKQLSNLQDIIEFKRNQPERVVLLMGNHDYHYTNYCLANGIQYSGFNGFLSKHLMPIYEELIKNGEIQIMFQHENYLFTHAGLTKTWMQRQEVTLENINEKLITEKSVFDFKYPKLSDHVIPDFTGNNKFQGPLWVRPGALLKDKLENFIHIVGHTNFVDITKMRDVYFIDTALKQYLLIDKEIEIHESK